MKKILLIGMSLDIGGAEKSLVNLLNMIDYHKYNIDLLLFKKKGPFLKQVPKEVNIIEIPEITLLYQSITTTLKKHMFSLNKLNLIIGRYIYTLICKLRWKNDEQMWINRWVKYYADLILDNKKQYDIAIAYAGGECAYYMFDKVSADKKVCYFHSDYSKVKIDYELERQYIDKADLVVTISDTCKDSLIKLFPEIEEHIIVLQNLSSKRFINKLADEYYPKEFINKDNFLKIVSVGRLVKVKGFDLAIEAANILKNHHYQFVWIVVGYGEEKDHLEQMIKDYKLNDYFKLVGLKENPYPYMKNADVLLQTSRYEGKSVVLDEAKILNLPVIATNYNSIKDQIHNDVDGLIVEMNPNDIANGIMKCHKDNLSRWKSNIVVNEEVEDIDNYMKCLFEK